MRTRSDSPTKSCTHHGCDNPLRAKGLCISHYNAINRTPNPTSEYTCPMCGDSFVKETARANRYKNVFCSPDCNVLYQMEHLDRRPATLKAMATRAAKKLASPVQPEAPQCVVHYSTCKACGTLMCHGHARKSYCSKRCENRARHIRRGKRHNIRRVAVFERDFYMCWICNQYCDPLLTVPDRFAATIDHLVPQSFGGTHDLDNLATAHQHCNSSRGASWSYPMAA